MVTYNDQNKRRSHNSKFGSTAIERKEEFPILTKQNSIQEEIKNRVKSRNACYHSVKNLLSSSFLYKNIQIKIYRNIILRVVCMGLKIGHSH